MGDKNVGLIDCKRCTSLDKVVADCQIALKELPNLLNLAIKAGKDEEMFDSLVEAKKAMEALLTGIQKARLLEHKKDT